MDHGLNSILLQKKSQISSMKYSFSCIIYTLTTAESVEPLVQNQKFLHFFLFAFFPHSIASNNVYTYLANHNSQSDEVAYLPVEQRKLFG